LYLLNAALWIFHAEGVIGRPSTKEHKTLKGPLAMPNLLPVGSQAPGFSLPANDGELFVLNELAGRKHVALVFYVGDNTLD
jgi:hypothetical protein